MTGVALVLCAFWTTTPKNVHMCPL